MFFHLPRSQIVSDKVKTFCNDIHEKLSALESRVDSLISNSGLTWHFLQEKLDEIRGRCDANQQACDQARAKLKQWSDDRKSESLLMIENWRMNREQAKLAERARDAEDQVRNAMLIAKSSIDDAERMILEAISARLDAESVGGDDSDDDLSAEVRGSISGEL